MGCAGFSEAWEIPLSEIVTFFPLVGSILPFDNTGQMTGLHKHIGDFIASFFT